MTTHHSPFPAELEVLLERGRTIPSVPDVVRARALTRARAIMAGTAATEYPPPAARRRGLTLALAASVALVVGAAGAVAAWRGPSLDRPEPAPSRRAAVRVAAVAPPAATEVPAPELLPAKAMSPSRPLTVQESYAAELALLSRAQVAYAGQDFSNVLTLVAEHGRRFPHGRLAEEREALRVRSLAKSGRADEARRAAAAFAERFPRSVMLPRLRAERY